MSQSFTIGTSAIRQHDGLFSLNDLHKAAGGAEKQKPSEWLRNQQTQDLVLEIEKAGIPAYRSNKGRGTYACRELVIAYAAWISPEFHLQVIKVFLRAAQPNIKNHEFEVLFTFICELIDSGRFGFDQIAGIAHKSNGRLLQMVDQAVISDKVRAIRSQIHGLNLAELHQVAELSGSLAMCEAAVIRKNGKTSEQLMEERK